MSLESGKKYGFIASLINVIMPVVAILLVVGLLAYQFSIYAAGGVGASLFGAGAFLGVFVVLGAVSIIGLILFFLAMHRLAQYYNEPSIFKNVLYGFIITIVGVIIALIIDFGFILTAASRFPQVGTPSTAGPIVAQFILGYMLVLAIGFICAIITAVLYWRAFTKLGEKSGVESFKTTGLLYLIGAALTIIAVGAIITWIAWIYSAMSFRKLQPKPQPAPIASTYPPATDKIYCNYCGTENQASSIYCRNCGKPLRTTQASV